MFINRIFFKWGYVFACLSLLLSACGSTIEENPISTLPVEVESQDFDTFVDQSFHDLLARDPEAILELGLGHQFGIDGCELTNISAEFVAETQQIESIALNTLHSFNFELLSPEQQRTYQIYEWYLDDLVRGHDFQYFDYPVNHMIIGVQNDLFSFLTDLYQINDRQDAEGYISCLRQVGDKFSQLIDALELRAEQGIILPVFLIDWVNYDLEGVINSSAQQTEYYITYVERLADTPDVDAAMQARLLDQAADVIEHDVIPAYRELRTEMNSLRHDATDTIGLWQYPDGEEAYSYLLRHHTTTEITAEEIHNLGLSELGRIHSEMSSLFDQLRYPMNVDLSNNYARVANNGGFLSNTQILEGYQSLIIEASLYSSSVFNRLPQAEVEVRSDPVGGYYVPPSMDGSRPGIFFARTSGTEYLYNMPTLAYHEAVPGHHLQLALAGELDLPFFQRIVGFTGFSEGWALYAERLMSELGAYQDDIYGDLGRLQAEARRAARMVVDTGIHAYQWTYEDAVQFMVENTGLPHQLVEYEVARMAVWPGQAVSYDVGFLRILQMREEAQIALGSHFNLGDFHSVILEQGSIPLELLENEVQAFIHSSD